MEIPYPCCVCYLRTCKGADCPAIQDSEKYQKRFKKKIEKEIPSEVPSLRKEILTRVALRKKRRV
ncbi:MAG: hypothetical protein ACOX0X_02225 [Candidatus Dojkabacteria bacterium]